MKRITPYVLMLAACGASAAPSAPTAVASQPARSTPPSQATSRPTPPVRTQPSPAVTSPSAPVASTPVADLADPAAGTRHATVKARLVAIIHDMPLCGILHGGSVVEYEVLAVEAGSLTSLRFVAAVGCIQMPRASYDTNAGTLQHFTVGDIHRLVISNDVADSRGMAVVATPRLYYVISADPA